MYQVKEIFYTLQGEGHWAGRPAVFCRFALCNLWTGREEDRARAVCKFCDTDFVGGDKYESALELVNAIVREWRGGPRPMVVFTGGEPTLQLDEDILGRLHHRGFYIAIETNGTRTIPFGIDWVCVSPKAEAVTILRSGNELKLVYPQKGLEPHAVLGWGFDEFYIQPMDHPGDPELTALARRAALQYVMDHPQWSLSIQTHKLLGIR